MFIDLLKLADVTSLHKGDEKTSKKSHRPESVLSTVSTVFEILMNKYITNYIEPCLPSILCGFRKGYYAQHTLESWKGGNGVYTRERTLEKS